jgi:hypothetical protein
MQFVDGFDAHWRCKGTRKKSLAVPICLNSLKYIKHQLGNSIIRLEPMHRKEDAA